MVCRVLTGLSGSKVGFESNGLLPERGKRGVLGVSGGVGHARGSEAVAAECAGVAVAAGEGDVDG